MKIEEVETLLTCPDRNYLLVKIRAGGFYGYGDATLNGRERAVETVLREYLAPILQGRDARNIEDIWQSIYRHSYWRGGPVLQSALAGVDTALWDLKGRALGVPVYQLLGGRSRERIPVYLHVHGDEAEELLRRTEALLERGIEAVRYSFTSYSSGGEAGGAQRQIYRQPHQDIAREERFEREEAAAEGLWNSEAYLADLPEITRRLRREFGARLRLIHDVHGRLAPAEAVRAARELEEFGLFFLEDPVEPALRRELHRLRSVAATPVAMGELFTAGDQFRELFEERLIDFLRADVSHYGGITPAMKTAHTAAAFGIRTAFHGPGDLSPVGHAAQLHMDTVLSNFGIQEFLDFDPRLREVFSFPFRLEGGAAVLEDAPGLGVEVDEVRARSYPYRRAFIPGLRDESGAVTNW